MAEKLEKKVEVNAESPVEAKKSRVEKKQEIVERSVETTASGIEIGEPLDLRPKNLPLVVKLPEGASTAQKEYAKVLNGYAYQNPKKWAKKKNQLIKRLESLAGVEVVAGDVRLSLNKSSVSFAFIKDGKGNEFYAGQHPAGQE